MIEPREIQDTLEKHRHEDCNCCADIVRLTDYIAALEAERGKIIAILEASPELNMSNYNEDEVAALNNGVIEVWKLLHPAAFALRRSPMPSDLKCECKAVRGESNGKPLDWISRCPHCLARDALFGEMVEMLGKVPHAFSCLINGKRTCTCGLDALLQKARELQ